MFSKETALIFFKEVKFLTYCY